MEENTSVITVEMKKDEENSSEYKVNVEQNEENSSIKVKIESKEEPTELVTEHIPQSQLDSIGCSGELKEEQPPLPISKNLCIRNGCSNPAVVNSEWEDEYCSNECVVAHCRNVFSSWVETNQIGARA